MQDTAGTDDDTTTPTLLEDVLGLLPRLAERTAAQVDLLGTVLSMLPCTRARAASEDDGDVPPAHEARQPTDVLTILAEDGTGSESAPQGDGGGEPSEESETEPEPEEPAAPPVEDLAIPEYDSLAASQVVPRLTTLSPEELEAVGAYESANRRRRTILNRVTQLLAD